VASCQPGRPFGRDHTRPVALALIAESPDDPCRTVAYSHRGQSSHPNIVEYERPVFLYDAQCAPLRWRARALHPGVSIVRVFNDSIPVSVEVLGKRGSVFLGRVLGAGRRMTPYRRRKKLTKNQVPLPHPNSSLNVAVALSATGAMTGSVVDSTTIQLVRYGRTCHSHPRARSCSS